MGVIHKVRASVHNFPACASTCSSELLFGSSFNIRAAPLREAFNKPDKGSLDCIVDSTHSVISNLRSAACAHNCRDIDWDTISSIVSAQGCQTLGASTLKAIATQLPSALPFPITVSPTVKPASRQSSTTFLSPTTTIEFQSADIALGTIFGQDTTLSANGVSGLVLDTSEITIGLPSPSSSLDSVQASTLTIYVPVLSPNTSTSASTSTLHLASPSSLQPSSSLLSTSATPVQTTTNFNQGGSSHSGSQAGTNSYQDLPLPVQVLIPIFVIIIICFFGWYTFILRPAPVRNFTQTCQRHMQSLSSFPSFRDLSRQQIPSISRSARKGSATRKFEIDGSERKELETIEKPQELPSRSRSRNSKTWPIFRLLSFKRARPPREGRVSGGDSELHLRPASVQSSRAPTIYKRSRSRSQSQSRSRSRGGNNRRPSPGTQRERNANAAAIEDHMSFEFSVLASLAARAQTSQELKSLRVEQGRIQAEREAIELREREIRNMIRNMEDTAPVIVQDI